MRGKPHYIKKHVYCYLKPGESKVFTKFLNEKQARELTIRTLFCGNIVARGFKDDTPVLTATKEYNHTVGLKSDGRKHCFRIAVIFVEKSFESLSERDIITAYPY